MSLWGGSKCEPMAAVWDEGSSWFSASWGAVLPPLLPRETVISVHRRKISLFLGVSGARPAGTMKPPQLQQPGASMDLPGSVPQAGSMNTSPPMRARKPDVSWGDTQVHGSSTGKCKHLHQI